MKETIERLVNVERFGMRALHENVWPLIEESRGARRLLPPLRDRLGSLYQKLGYLILRNVFLIELVKVPAIETTKVRTRWYPQLEGDQRWASFDDCLAIACDLITELAGGWLDASEHEEILRLFFHFPLLPYEGPLDYQSRPAPGDNQTKIHRRGNLVWMSTETVVARCAARRPSRSQALLGNAGREALLPVRLRGGPRSRASQACVPKQSLGTRRPCRTWGHYHRNHAPHAEIASIS